MKRMHFTGFLVVVAVLALAAQSFAVDVADISTLRAQSADGTTVYTITGTVVVTAAPNSIGTAEMAIQDSSGTDGQTGILIYDSGNGVLGTSLLVGDQLQNLTGTLSTYANHMEFHPTVAASSSGTTTPPAPLVVDSSITDVTTIDGELIRINGASAAAGNWGGGTFLTSPIGPMNEIYVATGCPLYGTVIPTGSFDMIGIAIPYNTNNELAPRSLADQITAASTDDPNAELDKGSIDFGYLNVNSTRDVVVTIDNAVGSTQNLVISSPGFNMSGGNPGSFTIVNSPSFPITLAAGESTSMTLEFTSGGSLGASFSADATLVSNDPNNPVLPLAGHTADQVVANLSELRAIGDTASKVLVSGTCVVVAGRNQVGSSQSFVQDDSGTDGQTGIEIYDTPNNLGQTTVIGDQVQNLCGTLTTYNGMLELVPVGLADFIGTTTPPDPLVVTPSITDFSTIQGELVQVNSALVDNGGDTTFGPYGYNIVVPSDILITQVYVYSGSGIIGETIPLIADYIGIAAQYNTTLEILPRIAPDVVVPAPPLSANTNWALYE